MASMFAAPGAQARLTIPLLESSDVVVIPVSSLPEEVEELLEILAAEAAPLTTWFDFAKAYLATGKDEAFRHICEEGVKDEVTEEVIRFFGAKPVYEQTQFHCGLAALHMARGREEGDKARKAECFALAAKHIQAAKLMIPEEQMVTITEGLLHLAKNEVKLAKQSFTKACTQQNHGRVNVMALLNLAALLFNQKDYKDALLLYRRALATNPACPAEVRLGIAACQFHLGEMGASAQAFERVLALDPHNANALMGLAVIKFRSSNVQQGLADGLRLLVRAYESDPGNVGVLVLLAHYALLRGDIAKVIVLAKSALDAAQSEPVQALCLCLLARAHHAQGQYDEALSTYAKALQFNTNLGLAHLGLAQLYVRQSNIINASTELDLALKASPGLFEALKIVGQVAGDDPTKVSKALTHMRTAIVRTEEDPDVRELLAEMCATAGDHAGSLTAYKKALALHRARRKESEDARAEWQRAAQERRDRAAEDGGGGGGGGLFGDDDDPEEGEDDTGPSLHVIPAILLNNVGVLCYRAGEMSEAAALFEEAMQVAKSTDSADLSPQHMLALRYNIARVNEVSGQVKEAEDIYKAILAEDPKYIDCVLRLACVARTKGATQEAFEWATKATELEEGNADALAMLAQLAMESKEYQQADRYIKQLSAQSKSRPAAPGAPMGTDAYAQIANGNLLLATLPPDRRKPEDARRADDRLFKALECFRSVLKVEPKNAFAANGVGAVLAELGLLAEAQDVFGEVQAAVAAASGFLHLPDVFINMASVALAKQDNVTAQKLYKKAMEKLGDTKKSQVLLYLARACYDSDDLPAAKSYLLRALHMDPTNHQLRFNVALTVQEYAVRTFKKKRGPGDLTKAPEFDKARSDLEIAMRYFEHLNALGPASSKLDQKKLESHIKFCKETMQKAEIWVAAARNEAAHLAAKRQELEALRAVENERKALEAKRKAAAEKAAQEARELEAKKAHEKAERLKQEWRQQRTEAENAEEAAGEGKKKGKGKKAKGEAKGAARSMAGEDEEPSEGGEGDTGNDMQPTGDDNDTQGGKRKRIARAQGANDEEPELGDDLFGSESDDEDFNPAQEGLEDEDADGGGSGAGGGSRKRNRGAVVDDDDDQGGVGDGGDAAPQGEDDNAPEDSGDAFLNDLDAPPEGVDQPGAEGLEDDLAADEPAAKKPRRTALEDSEGEEDVAMPAPTP